jgi:hypothetical protein
MVEMKEKCNKKNTVINVPLIDDYRPHECVRPQREIARIGRVHRLAGTPIDPDNDFLSAGGKLRPRVREVAEQVGLIENLKTVVKTVRGEEYPGVLRTPSSLGARGL